MACAKCRSGDVGVTWHAVERKRLPGICRSLPGEHLHYHCRQCRYEWTGLTADQERWVPVNDARLEGFHAGREWMKQGAEYVAGWRDGVARAFEALGEPKDEVCRGIQREHLYPSEIAAGAKPTRGQSGIPDESGLNESGNRDISPESRKWDW